MGLLIAVLFGLNIVQGSKDIQRCQKEDFKASGCSIYKKINLDKTK